MKRKNTTFLAVFVIICAATLTARSVSEKKAEPAKESGFYIEKFNEKSRIFAQIKGKTYKDDCTVPVSHLRYVHTLCKSLDGSTHEGEMVCNKYIAEDLLEIFRKLYEADYPIERMVLIDEYDADDEKSMEDNNSSCFNFRFISHTKRVSKHGLGLAVDINPLYNPYIKEVDGKTIIEPVTAGAYTDRNADFNYKIDENDLAYKLFTEHGFEWGGSWQELKDYQHFEIPTPVIEKLYKQK
ncbi:MAG: M15 family metallopeptidase [Treponema sp.]|nr:M15 family metallopeptidase [Treponema sp.]